MIKIFQVIFCFIIGLQTFAQDLYIKSYPTSPTVFIQNQNVQIESLDNGNYVVAGTHDSPNTIGTLFIRMFNACGIELWHREMADSTISMDLMDLNIDSSNHILIAGNVGDYNQLRRPYLIKYDLNGNLIFSKLLSSAQGYSSLLYSGSVAPNGDYLIYGLHHYRTSPPNYAKIMISRISPNGTLKWVKNYEFGYRSWGRMIATSDNGALAKTSNTIFKVDSMGVIEWAKSFYPLGSLRTPIETDSGYVFSRYYIGAIDRGSAFNLNFNGELTWNTQSFFNFFPNYGIKKRNGNLLFPATNPLNGNTAVFLELNYKNGNIVKHEEFQDPSINGIIPNSISETNTGEILFSGVDNRGILQQMAIGKLSSSLNTISCNNLILPPPSDPYDVIPVQDETATIANNNDLMTVDHTFIITQPNLSIGMLDCGYTFRRGNYNLGNDTILCIGQSLILGDNSTSFDSYLWSNGSNNKTIGINQSGIYWLQVVSACDTLRDSIQVDYLPKVSFWLGADTTTCLDSITIGQQLNPVNSYIWSTGETTTSIVVKTSGTYWVEYSDKCYTTRDSIDVYFQPPLAPVYLGNDTILCPKSGIVLGNVNSPYETFTWSDGSNNKLLNVDSAGLYWLEAADVCNLSRDSIQIFYYPEIGLDIGADRLLCENELIVLRPTKPFSNYLWSTGAITPSIVVSVAGIYWLETQTNCGVVRDSVLIELIPKIQVPNLGNDTMICFNTAFDLNANTLGSFIWSTGDASNVITVGSGVYWLEYYNDCDTLRDSIVITESPSLNPSISMNSNQPKSRDTILFIHKSLSGLNPSWNFGDGYTAIGDSVLHSYFVSGTYTVSLQVNNSRNCIEKVDTTINIEPQDYFIPNIFTPNNDLKNDQFKPYGNDIKSYSMKIYDNWGKVIFSESNIAWNGRDKAQRKVGDGTYFYVIQLELYHGVKEEYSGPVNLVR